MNNPKGIDREGNEIKLGMVVAVAVSVNQSYTYDSYTVRICRKVDGRLVLDAPTAYAYLDDVTPNQLQIFHADLSLSKLDNDFRREFETRDPFAQKSIRSHNAHEFYNDVYQAMEKRFSGLTDIENYSQVRSLMLKLLDLSEISDEKVSQRMDAARVKLAAMETVLQHAARDLNRITSKA